MQTVDSAFTAEAKDSLRDIAHSLQVSWKNDSTVSNRTFTIGVSTIGGNHSIGANPGAIGSPGNYRYFDESDYVTDLAYERGFNMPLGGISRGMFEARLDNTSGRFTPRYMGGSSELYTAIQPNKPVIISAGFNVDGVDTVLPQLSGLIHDQPEVDQRTKQVKIRGYDYIDFFAGRYLDHEVMFTAKRTDEIMTTLLTGTLGMSTAQFDLDYGINTIPFGIFDKGTTMQKIFHDLAEAENGHFYQDEQGIFRFENRQHWDNAPHTTVQQVIYTAQVIDAKTPDDDHIINVVEVNSNVRQKQPIQTIFTLPTSGFIEIPGNSTVDKFLEFDDPALSLTDPTDGGTDSYFVANLSSDGSSTDMSSSVNVTNLGTFARSVKYRFSNTSAQTIYITELVLGGRVAKLVSNIYYRAQDDSSVTAYNERLLKISNDYIQNEYWANSYANIILGDFAEIENLQQITILAQPQLQLGDLISWQGRYWRIYDIKTTMNPSYGFVQELTLLQRTISSYFIIGRSTIGGSDKIAP